MQKPKDASFILLRKKPPSPFTLIETKEEAHFSLFPQPEEQKPYDSLSGKEIEKTEAHEKKDNELGLQEEEIKTKAYQEGFQSGTIKGKEEGLQLGEIKGKEEGKKEALQQLAPLIESLKNVINQINYAQTAILKNQEKEILHLCIQMAQKIIHTEIQQNPQILLANLKEGLKSVGRHKITAIKLNPLDLDLLQNSKKNIPQPILNLQGIDLKGDPNLLQGGCVIETDLGYVDASIENQLQELKNTFEETQGAVENEF